MLEEFKKFALRGIVVDLAVGVILGGAAFQHLCCIACCDIIMPIIGAITVGWIFPITTFPCLPRPARLELSRMPRKPAQFWGLWSVHNSRTELHNRCLRTVSCHQIHETIDPKEEVKADVAAPPELPADVKLLTEIRDEMQAMNRSISTR